MVFEAKSTNDATAEPMQSTVTVVVQPATTNAALVGGGLEELSQDQIQLYAAIGGGVIVFFLLIFVVGRLVRRSSGPELEEVTELDEPVMPVAAAPVATAAPVDEFDGMFDDLDGADEFDFDGRWRKVLFGSRPRIFRAFSGGMVKGRCARLHR